jgi:tetratricopeptide (TPR) repeat protein
MPNIDLKTAVAKIYQVVDERRRRQLPSPFFFIAGAGVSNPPIPLALEIEAQCKLKAQRYGKIDPPDLKSAMDSYSYWLDKAYPSAEGLQNYLRGLMEGKPISKANLRLAHLLLDGRLARTVFTPNFDDMLTRALELFGQRPLVCDHPLTVDRMWIGSDDIQIIHVHGSYRYYDCCNLRQDIADRSQNVSMSMMLGQTLRDHSPLVVGYSGWDCDILMSSLQHRISSARLGTPAFWFCYKRESLAALPTWLIQSKDVFFVLPDDPVPPTANTSDSESSVPRSQVSLNSSGMVGIDDPFIDDKAPTLPANRALDALVHKFQLSAPEVTQNPLSFYADYLKRLLGTNEPGGESDTFYGFRTVIARVERARDSEEEEKPDLLREFRDAMSEADYRKAIQSANRIDLGKLSSKERIELVFALMDACQGFGESSAEEIAGYDLLVSAADLLLIAGSTDLRLRKQVAAALYRKGCTLGKLEKNQVALAAYDDLLRRFGDAQENEIRSLVARAIVNKGCSLARLGKSEEAIKAYDEALRCFADSQESEFREPVAKALWNKGRELRQLGKAEEAIAAYDEVARRFAGAQEPEVKRMFVYALSNKSSALWNLDRRTESLELRDDIARRFADAPEPEIRRVVAAMLVGIAISIGELNGAEDEIAAYDEILRRFANDQDPRVWGSVALALYNKGYWLNHLNKSDEAIAVWDESVCRFKDDHEPAVREWVAKALSAKGDTLFKLNRSDEAMAVWDEVERRFTDAREPEILECVANALYARGNALFKLNRNEEAISVCDDFLLRFKDTQEPRILEWVAKALYGKGNTFSKLNRTEEATAVYKEVLSRFADAQETKVRDVLKLAKDALERLLGNAKPEETPPNISDPTSSPT